MPFLNIQTNVEIVAGKTDDVLAEATQKVAQLLGKDPKWIMVALQPGVPMSFGASERPCAYVQLKSIGLPGELTAIAEEITAFITQALDVPADRIFLDLINLERGKFAFNGHLL